MTREATRPGTVVLVATVLIVAVAMVVWQDWWTLPFLVFGILVSALDRHGTGFGRALGIGLAIASSLLATASGLVLLVLSAVASHAACGDATPCPTGPDPLLVLAAALIVIGMVGLVVSVWWLARTWRMRDDTRTSLIL
jgi:hypothetical protein